MDDFQAESYRDRTGNTLRRWIREGNVRHIVVHQDERIIVELPMTVAVAGTLLAPWLALLGVFAALAADCSIEVRPSGVPEQPVAPPEDVIP